MINIRPVSDLRNKSNETEAKLDEADKAAELNGARYTAEEVFDRARERANAHKAI